jgi:hypothetical protein
MKEEQDYIRDIADIRSMMERSSKFLSLSGWAGIMAGIYALSGAYMAWKFFDFNPAVIIYSTIKPGGLSSSLTSVIFLAILVLILSIGTASFLSYLKANKRGEKIWNATTRRLLGHIAVPLVTGGLLIVVLVIKGLIGWIAPFTLIFYGLALYNASKFTYSEVKVLGFSEIGLGLISSYYVEYGLFFWALGFGIVHIIYGIYMYYKYER